MGKAEQPPNQHSKAWLKGTGADSVWYRGIIAKGDDG